MSRKINLNSDMGESFGRYTLGNDEALMPLLTAANVACGYHAADPATMRSSVQLAKKHGVGVGAHISYPDLVGFGRRDMILSREEVADITVHQIGALWGFCQAEGVPLEHVKGHGYLGVKSWADEVTLGGIIDGMLSVDPNLILLTTSPFAVDQCQRAGIPCVAEGYVDLDFTPDGKVMIEKEKQGRDPATMADKAMEMFEKQQTQAIDGSWIDMPTQSICIHGDGPNAAEIATALRARFQAEGVQLVGLRELWDGEPGAAQAAE